MMNVSRFWTYGSKWAVKALTHPQIDIYIYNLKHAWIFFPSEDVEDLFLGLNHSHKASTCPLNKGNNRGIFRISSTRMVEIRFLSNFQRPQNHVADPNDGFFREFIQTLLTLW